MTLEQLKKLNSILDWGIRSAKTDSMYRSISNMKRVVVQEINNIEGGNVSEIKPQHEQQLKEK